MRDHTSAWDCAVDTVAAAAVSQHTIMQNGRPASQPVVATVVAQKDGVVVVQPPAAAFTHRALSMHADHISRA